MFEPAFPGKFLMPEAAAAPSDLVIDGSDATFKRDVLDASKTQPVVVDFWAPWCGPCKTLAPALEKVVRAKKGAVKLVKINIDEHPAIAGQLGVRSIPAVFAFDKGRPVDGFMGALPESQIKVFVDRLGGAGAAGAEGDDDLESALTAAGEALAEGDLAGAAQLYAAVLQADPENVKALAGMARCYLQMGEPGQAREIIDMVPEDKRKDAAIQGVVAALELAAGANGSDDSAALERQISANPDDHQARYDLAGALAARGDLEGAMDQLLTVIQKDRAWNEEAARKQLLKIFEAAGPMSELSKSGRRRLSAILFS
jgi:putative thioredoxin